MLLLNSDLADDVRYRPREYDTEDGPWDPITGGASAILGTLTSLSMGIADLPIEVLKSLRSRSSQDGREDEGMICSSSGRCFGADDNLAHEKSQSANTSRASLDAGPTRSFSFESESKSGPTSPGVEIEPTLSGSTLPDKEPGSAVRSPTAKSTASAMSTVMGSNSDKPGSRSASPARSSSLRRKGSLPHVSLETAVGAGKAAGRIVGVGLKSPMDFTLSIARGFHNAPKLYGDESVRQPDKVTNLQSGLKAAGKVMLSSYNR